MGERRRRHVVTVAAALAGVVLLAYAVVQAGTAQIASGVRRVGWGLAPILGLAGLRFLVRAEAWRLCMPPAARLPLRQAFAAFLAGDAVGSVTPLGLAASEPAKVLLTSHRLATREAVASLALDNLIYAGSIAAMIAIGAATAIATVPLPVEWREAGVALLALLVAGVGVALRALRGTWRDGWGERPAWRRPLASLRQSVMRFSAEHAPRLWRVFALDGLFHALAVLEVFLVLRWLLGDRSPTLAQAVVFEALNRTVTVVFKFVPFRVGVDEALSGALAPVLAVQSATGVTLALVRKARNLVWAGAGLLLVAAHPAPGGPAVDRP
jgi:hypothetical protein